MLHPSPIRWPGRSLHLCLALLLGASLIGSGGLVGQTSPKAIKPAQKKSDDPSLDNNKKKEEEEEPVKGRHNVPPPRVGDEEVDTKPARPAAIANLEREANRTSHPVLHALYAQLAKPHDLITMASGQPWRIAPLPQLIGPKTPPSQVINVRKFNDKGGLGKEVQFNRDEIRRYQPYERLGLEKVEEFLAKKLHELPDSSDRYLSRPDTLRAADKVLVALIGSHESARERGLREGDDWESVKNSLRSKLQEVRLEQLSLLTSAQKWEAAFDFALRLAEDYPKAEKVHLEIVRLLATQAEQALQDDNYREARKRLLLLQAQFPDSPALVSVRQRLHDKAEVLKQEAVKLAAKGDKAGIELALAKLRVAEEIDPKLQGLHELFTKLRFGSSPPLLVGVAELPQQMSPALAFTDSEKQAVELMFESLVRLTEGDAGPRYVPELAAELPRQTHLGREFSLKQNAYWSNGDRVTATDVRHTISLLSDSNWKGRIPEWAKLMGPGTIDEDNFRIRLTLLQGYIDPLSLMGFKILPEKIQRADDPEFATKPIGSGPYFFKNLDGEYAVFTANSGYELRSPEAPLPTIREIRFFHSKDPARDFQNGRLHLLLDLPTHRLKELRSLRDVTLKTMTNRRIYFLAVNHRHKALESVDLRRAIAHAINREDILNKFFRDGTAHHKPLSGPYPPKSWACDKNIKADPFDQTLAKSLLMARVNMGRGAPGKLTLKYPKVGEDDDPTIASACAAIHDQLHEVGIEVELQPRTPHELRHDVEVLHDYDLAYYHYDYPDESYCLWPLFDNGAVGQGEGNYLGYQNDSNLQSLLHSAMNHRQLAKVQEVAHQIHILMYERMPFIPLWQLDTHLAIHDNLKIPGLTDESASTSSIDPLLIFDNAQRWRLTNP
ncbi:MAG TPA: ABC transporter substrate-binding protein [Gemmataceae bacterium]|nr:ABC transporter substrate-binding protein [Gemmataceae bacterium]